MELEQIFQIEWRETGSGKEFSLLGPENVSTVAEQRASYLFGKSPKLCGWKIYVICHSSYFASPVLTLLLNTSRSLLLLRIICLVSTVPSH